MNIHEGKGSYKNPVCWLVYLRIMYKYDVTNQHNFQATSE